MHHTYPNPFFYIGDIIPDPYRVGDFPINTDQRIKKGWTKISDYTEDKKGIEEILKNLQKPGVPQSVFDKQVWFDYTDGSLSFKLEVVGYGKEHISAEIKNSVLHVSGKNGQKSFNQQYQIPSPEKLDLAEISAKVEHGLLEIVFPAKKTEVKTIKVL